MPADWTTEQLRLFLLAHVENVEQLELLLSMGAHPDDALTAELAVARVGVTGDEARAGLEHLAAHGFLATELNGTGPLYSYRPTPELRAGVDALADARAQSATTLVKLMSTNAVERMRTWTMKAFADAFVVGRKKDDG